MEEIMLRLIEFRHIHHPSGVKMLANLFDVESGKYTMK